jgi:hypothetical protein
VKFFEILDLHIKRFFPGLYANNSFIKKLHSEMKNSEMLGFEKLLNGALSRSFFLMNPWSMRVLVSKHMGRGQKVRLFRIQFISGSAATSAFSLQ